MVIPLLTQHYAMLQRNLVYTGLTRGRQLVVLVGQKKALAMAVLLVGKAYTAQLGLQPGDEFEIKLGRKQIKLIPLGAADEE